MKHYYTSVHQLNTQQLVEGSADPWDLFGELISNYMHKSLTFEGDILAAFQAILNSWNNLPSPNSSGDTALALRACFVVGHFSWCPSANSALDSSNDESGVAGSISYLVMDGLGWRHPL